MASSSGTFTAVEQKSDILSVSPGASIEIVLTNTGGHAWRVDLELMVLNDFGHVASAIYSANTASTIVTNQSSAVARYRLRCSAVNGGDTIAYVLRDYAVTWIAPALQNSWVNRADATGPGGLELPAGYWLDSAGVVHLRFALSGGNSTLGTVLFTLPVGYRPEGTYRFLGLNGTTWAAFNIDNVSGDVTLQTAGGPFCFGSFSFRQFA